QAARSSSLKRQNNENQEPLLSSVLGSSVLGISSRLPVHGEAEGHAGHLNGLVVRAQKIAAADALSQVEEDEANAQVDVARQLIGGLAANFATEYELARTLIVHRRINIASHTEWGNKIERLLIDQNDFR